MVGTYRFKVKGASLAYDFTIRQNITFIQGDSGTGKTTLIDMLEAFEQDSFDSGVQVESKVEWEVLTTTRWKDGAHREWCGKVVFMDEHMKFLTSGEFAKFVRDSDNYVVVISREPHKELYSLPYSVKEIYGLCHGDEGNYLFQIYKENQFLPRRKPDVIVTEDRKSGYQFFQAVAEKVGAVCFPSGGRDNIKNVLSRNDYFEGKTVLVVADGAAFGSQVKFYAGLMNTHTNVQLWLPESFEHLILQSKMFEKDAAVKEVLANPSQVISTEYFSWERYFTDLLVKTAEAGGCKYDKSRLNECFKEDCCCKEQECSLFAKGNKQDMILGEQASVFAEQPRFPRSNLFGEE